MACACAGASLEFSAAGGGVITSNVIRNALLSAGQTTYTVVEYSSGGDALNALANGDVDAVEFTGAAPLPNLSKLNSDYKILSIPDNVAHELSDIYHPATVTYVNMRPDAVQTIAADCIVVARDYKSPRLWKPLKQFRDLFYQDLTDIQETPGNHTKWQEVKADNHGKWPWLPFGSPSRRRATATTLKRAWICWAVIAGPRARRSRATLWRFASQNHRRS